MAPASKKAKPLDLSAAADLPEERDPGHRKPSGTGWRSDGTPFEGARPEDYFGRSAEAEDESQRESLRRRGEILQRWYEYLEEHRLRALDYLEAAELSSRAFSQVEREHGSLPPKPLLDPGVEETYADTAGHMASLARYARLTLEKLRGWGYVVYPLEPLEFHDLRHALWPAHQDAVAEVPDGIDQPPPFHTSPLFGEPDPDIETFMAPTGPVHAHITTHVMNREEYTETSELKMTIDGHSGRYRARSRLELPPDVQAKAPEQMLQRMTDTLLKTKQHSAALLKTQLDLTNQAWHAGSNTPIFWYDYEAALERLGYKRIEKPDGRYFHTETLREHHERVSALASQWLTVWEIKGKSAQEKYIDEAPYWEIVMRRRLRESDAIGNQVVLFPEPHTPVVKGVMIRPGIWWPLARIRDFHYPLPGELLRLPTDGKGNETQRYALQIAAVLALWVRSSQKRHAGDERPYGIGKLLEEARIISRETFMGLRSNHAARRRAYLAGDDDGALGGALGILRDTGAFDIRVRDPFDFWATGRGWQATFWDAQMTVRIPAPLSKRRDG